MESITEKKSGLFDIGLIIYFISLFISDIALENTLFAEKSLHYISYIFFILHIVFTNMINKEHFLYFLLGIFFSFGLSVFTHDIYWSAVSLMVLSVRNIDSRHIIKICYNLLLISTIIVLIMLMIGILQNNVTNRTDGYSVRYGMGFYHSDVLPMIVFYLLIYRFLICGKNIKILEIIFWNLLSIGVFTICDGRNGFYGTALCSIMYFLYNIFEKKKKSIWIDKKLGFIAKYTLYACIIFSFTMVALQGMYLTSVSKINKLFSGRFAIAYHQIEKSGINIVSFLSRNEYREIANVIDNGYLYTSLRYGLLFLLFYIIVNRNLLRKYPFNFVVKIVVIGVTVTNMVDNDLYSYGFLPIFMIAFSDYPIIYETSEENQLSI